MNDAIIKCITCLFRIKKENIAEAVAPETRQCNAMKGLIKDAINQAYYDSIRGVWAEIETRDIERGCEHAPIMSLNANSLADILVD